MQVEVHSYSEIGDYLREVRESQGLDLRQIAHQLNIRAKYLEALEDGRLDILPGKVYARGYLRHYAEYLGLNKEELAEAFDRVDNPVQHMRYYVPEPNSRNYQPGMVLVIGALVAVLAVYHYWYRHHTLPAPRDYEMVSPVPERLLESVLETSEEGEVQPSANDDLFVDPMLPMESSEEEVGNAPDAAARQAEKLPWRKRD